MTLGNRERLWQTPSDCTKGSLISAHAQVIGPVEIGENAKVGAAAVVVADVPSDVTVVGIPAKIVRLHGKKDEPVIHEVEENESIMSINSSRLKMPVTDRLVCRGYLYDSSKKQVKPRGAI